MDEKQKTGEHYACVIKDGKYIDFVIVEEYSDGTEIPYMYTLKQGETLARTNPPTYKVNAESVGFIAPVWDGKEWKESATAEEIKQWNKEHPAPVPVPTDVEILQKENRLLKAQVNVLENKNEFLEDCIIELADVIYA